MFSYFIGSLRIAAFVLWTAAVIGPYSFFMLARFHYRKLGSLYWASVGKILGVRVRRYGKMTARQPLMVVANHTSYLDIVTLGGCVPGVFIAKAEVGQWPGFNLIAKVARTVFVNRQRAATGQAKAEIRARFEEGDPLILFPEGTSNDGNRVLPFKSALFAVADDPVELVPGKGPEPVWIQPVSIAYTEVDGYPMGRMFRPLVAWYGDMELLPHLIHLASFGRATADIIFHEPVLSTDFSSRKALSRHCHRVISDGVSDALRGRAGEATASIQAA